MQLTLRANHSMRLLMFCAVSSEETNSVAKIADACNMRIAHLAKIANTLTSNGFLISIRGRGGGVQLARPAHQINVGEVVRVMEVGTCMVECLNQDQNQCPLIDACRFRSILMHALEAFYTVLDGYTLADLVSNESDLRALMNLPTSD